MFRTSISTPVAPRVATVCKAFLNGCRRLLKPIPIFSSGKMQIPVLRMRCDHSYCLVIVGIMVILTSPASGKEYQAERIYSWNFQIDSDRNFDQKPDGWKRRQDRQHPAYIEMRIATRSPETAKIAIEAQSTLAGWMQAWKTGRIRPNYIPESAPPELANLLDRTVLNNCLEISMDGGAAELVGPMFPMESRYSYNLTAEISCQELNGHFAWIELHLLNEERQVIQVLQTEKMHGTFDWKHLFTEIASQPGEELKWGQIHLMVEPHSSTILAGIARFDSINIYRMPRLTLQTPLKYHLAQPGEEFDVLCEAMGIREHDAHVTFELQDHLGNRLREHAARLEISDSGKGTAAGAAPVSELAAANQPHQTAADAPTRSSKPHYVSTRSVHRSVDGQTTWRLQLDKPGLYRVKVKLGASGSSQQREILIGVMRELPTITSGPFGWSMPPWGERLSIEEVPDLVSRFGASWVKLPVWFDPDDSLTADKLIALIERLQAQGSQVVGKLDQPPLRLRETFGDSDDQLHAVNIFREPKDWEPVLEPVLTRIGMKLPWFQIGEDGDHSFVGKLELAETIASLRARMQTYSQELKLALSWNWLDPTPATEGTAWNAIHYSTAPQVTSEELDRYVANAPQQHELWVNIDPLTGNRYSLLDRVRDLTERMISVKRSAVKAAFVCDPLRPEFHLFTAQKKLGEILIPWHELVANLSSASYIGSIELPNKSINHVLADGNEALMVMWNDNPTSEQMFLGDKLQATDLFGREITVDVVQSERGTAEQEIPVDQWPIIVRGVNLDVIRFHQLFKLENDSLDGSATIGLVIPVSITNTLPQSASGKVTVVSPSLLNGDRSESPLQLSNGLTQSKQLPVFVRNDASAGEHRLRFDFDLMSNGPYHFSIYRNATLGSGEIELTWDATRQEKGRIELRVEVRNESEDIVSFDCKLFPPGLPYHRFRINDSKPGLTVQEIPLMLSDFPEGTEAWLRCELIGTGRVLNYRLKL